MTAAHEGAARRAAPPGGEGAAQARRALGWELARLRREAGFTQQGLAGRLGGYSRASVADAERGRRHHARNFWSGCDAALKTGGLLASRYDQLTASLAADAAVRAAEEAAEAAEQAAAGTAAAAGDGGHPADGNSRDRCEPVVTICCPNCGHSLAVMMVVADMTAVPSVSGRGGHHGALPH